VTAYGTLTERQRQVVWLIAQGATYREVAARLEVSVDTVKVHLRNAYIRLGALNAAHAVALAHEHRQITLERRALRQVRTRRHPRLAKETTK
jgi:DNA-binding CsgD family transcriptional regulator